MMEEDEKLETASEVIKLGQCNNCRILGRTRPYKASVDTMKKDANLEVIWLCETCAKKSLPFGA